MNNQEELLASFVDDIENEKLTIAKIDDFGTKVDEMGLKILFEKIEREELDLFALKIYATVYDKEKVLRLEKLKSKLYVDAMFAGMWNREAEDSTSEELSEAMLGFVIFGNDLISRIRNGYAHFNIDFSVVDRQVKDFISFFIDKINGGVFFQEITQTKTTLLDETIFKTENKDHESIRIIKQRIELANRIIFENLKSLETINKLYPTIKKENMSFLSNEDLFFWENDLVFHSSQISLKEDNENDSLLINNSDETVNEVGSFDVESENKFSISKIFSFLKTKKTKKMGLNTIRKENRQKGSHFKISVLLFLLIAVVGFSILAFTQKEKINEDVTIAEKIVNENIDTGLDSKSEKFNIKRTGTNKEEK